MYIAAPCQCHRQQLFGVRDKSSVIVLEGVRALQSVLQSMLQCALQHLANVVFNDTSAFVTKGSVRRIERSVCVAVVLQCVLQSVLQHLASVICNDSSAFATKGSVRRIERCVYVALFVAEYVAMCIAAPCQCHMHLAFVTKGSVIVLEGVRVLQSVLRSMLQCALQHLAHVI